MHTFQDKNGRNWTLTVNIGAMKRVRALCGIDLFNLIELEDGKNPKADVLNRLASDPILLVDVLFAVCQTEADARGIGGEEFGSAMTGDTIEAATNALLDEIVDFFPAAKRRTFQKLLAASRRFRDAAEDRLNAILADGTVDQELDAVLKKSLESATDTRGFSGSTPIPSRSAN